MFIEMKVLEGLCWAVFGISLVSFLLGLLIGVAIFFKIKVDI